ncbi:MAG: TonB-dependent receptor [Bacteroidales bacterium]|nr:TonB-dependent receptor [Bacteroidales bacterium]
MRKGILVLFLAIAAFSAAAQEKVVHRNIGLDSLMVILQKNTVEKVYYQSDESAKNLAFTVDQGRAGYVDQMKKDLEDNGYKILPLRGYLFVLKGVGLAQELPWDYFAVAKKQEKAPVSQDYIDALAGSANVATSQNKTYQIGDRGSESASGKAYLSGYVRDAVTGEPVVGVSLVDNTTRSYAQSDAHGFYKILLPVGKTVLDVSGYSLEDTKVHLQVYGEGSLDVVVKEKVYALSGVVVSAENANKVRTSQMGIEKVRMDRVKNVPMVFGESDVVKIILTLPGVKSVGEASSGFNVRGGATDQNLVLFNGGTVYNPSHLFGVFSGFNPDIVSDIELYKSSIPVEYGGRISSVLDVNSREGNNKKLTGSLGVGLLTAKGHIEGPIGKKTTFIAGARATYSDWLLSMLPEDSEYNDGSASFYDVTAGITHKFNEKNSIHINGYWSVDDFRFSADTSYNYTNANGSLKWKSNFGEKTSMELTAGYDHYDYATIDKFNPVEAYEMSFKIEQMFGKLKFKSLLSEKHTLTYGADAISYDLAPGSYLPYGGESLVVPDIIPNETGIEGAAYLSDSWSISDRVSLDFGVRYSMFDSDEMYHGPEYRLSGRVMLSDKVSFKAGINSMRQYIHMLSNSISVSPTDIWKLSDKKIKPQEGWQVAGGFYASLFNNKVEASIEGYYKEMDNYLDYKSGAVIIMNKNIADDVIITQGRAYGAELMLKKSVGKLNGWLSYTYSKTQLRERDERGVNAINGGQWYDASYDKPHDAKLVANYKFTHRVSISANADYSTGRPITVPVARYEYGGGYRLYYSDRNSYRIPDYMRIDAALNIEPTHKLGAFTHFSFSIGVYNVTGRKNVYSVYFDTDAEGQIQGHKLCIFGAPIPYVNFNFKF